MFLCVLFVFVSSKQPSAVLAIAILDWRAISRYFPNLHAFVIYLISRCCFMYWAWVKIGVPSTVKMTPNRRIVFQEYFSPYPGLLGQPKVIRRSPSWDYIFPPSNLSPVFLHCMIKAPKLRGHLSLLVEAWRYVQRTIIGHSTWISRLNDYIVTCWDMTICVNVNFDTGIFRYVRVFNASHIKPCVCLSSSRRPCPRRISPCMWLCQWRTPTPCPTTPGPLWAARACRLPLPLWVTVPCCLLLRVPCTET